jgi:hypothetical protein
MLLLEACANLKHTHHGACEHAFPGFGDLVFVLSTAGTVPD